MVRQFTQRPQQPTSSAVGMMADLLPQHGRESLGARARALRCVPIAAATARCSHQLLERCARSLIRKTREEQRHCNHRIDCTYRT